MTLLRTFFVSVVATMIGVLCYAFATPQQATVQSKDSRAAGRALLGGIFVRDQIALDTVPALKGEGVKAVINMRPDGEEQSQPTSAAVAQAAETSGLSYAFVPTPHGEIPDAVVDALAQALSNAPRPAVLYCRSGKRSSRVWALAEASRVGGASAAEISAAVKAVGQTVDDLMPRIEKRIGARGQSPAG